MTILNELYNGNIEPAQRFVKKGSEYQSLQNEFAEMAEQLTATLNKEQKQLFLKVEDVLLNLNSISEEEIYIDGFCTGAKMLLEILNYKSENFI